MGRESLPGHPLTFPGGINNKGQVVGHSCDATDTYCSAYLWENGVMTDLNTPIPRDSSLYQYYAGDINDRGEIAGVAIVVTTTSSVRLPALGNLRLTVRCPQRRISRPNEYFFLHDPD